MEDMVGGGVLRRTRTKSLFYSRGRGSGHSRQPHTKTTSGIWEVKGTFQRPLDYAG